MAEPINVVQTGEPEHLADPQTWIRERAREARERGCVHARATIRDEPPKLLLFEGWDHIPEDEGKPRFAIASASEGEKP